MNLIRTNHSTTIITLLALAAAGTLASVGTKAARAWDGRSGATSEDQGRGIAGVWRVEVQSSDCDSRAPLGAPFFSVLTFNEGGTMAGSTANPAFAIGQRGTDQGTWRRTGEDTYQSKDVALLFFTTAPNPPSSPGFEAGSQILSQTITLNRASDQFTSQARTEFFDASGNSYRQGCATAVANRFE